MGLTVRCLAPRQRADRFPLAAVLVGSLWWLGALYRRWWAVLVGSLWWLGALRRRPSAAWRAESVSRLLRRQPGTRRDQPTRL